MDRILISDILVRCVIGVNEEERRDKQDVIINLSIDTDLSRPGATDRIEDAVDYCALKKRILSHLEDSHYFLIEALAESIAKICLEDPTIFSVRVRVDKPGALRFARSVGVEIERSNKG